MLATAAVFGAGLSVSGLVAADAAPQSAITEFVTRDGSELRVGGERFRASGTNIYWLGLDENVGGVDFPTYFRIKDALDTAKQLGVNVVRSHMMTSTGQNGQNPLALMPELGVYNEEAFATIDYAIAYAGSIGIRLILPLTDEWSYYHGGHRDFTTPLGLESADFYSDPAAIDAYQDYVDRMLQHINPLTGLRLVDDPTILAWELGNELEGMTLEWIDQQVAFIKERAPEQLVAAGRRFDIDPDTLQSSDLDIVDVHYYPPTAEKVAADAATVAAADKVYIGGEYASTAATDAVLQSAAADPNNSGMFFWSLFGNNDRGGLVPHDDGFTLHYPGETDRMRSSVAEIQRYSEALGLPTGSVEVAEPLVTAIEQDKGINRIAWRGSAGAAGYIVQSSPDLENWTDITSTVSAEASPVTDLESTAGLRYRVLAVTASGEAIASDAVAASTGGAVLVDPLADWKLTSAHASARIIAPSGAQASADASATWSRTGIRDAEFRFLGSGTAQISGSADGQQWEVLDAVESVDGDVTTLRVTGIELEHIRIEWSDGRVLDRATISNAAPRVALFDPLDDFSLTHEHAGSLSFDRGNPQLFGGDTSRVKRDAADGAESITWTYDDISGADLVAYAWPDQPITHLVFEGSVDGSTWSPLTAEVLGGTGNWRQYTYRLRDLSGIDYLRASWPAGTGEVWTPQIAQLSLYSPNAPEVGTPDAPELAAPADGLQEVRATPEFSWAASSSAAFYRFELATDGSFAEPVFSRTGLTGTSLRPSYDLAPGTTYFWRVAAVNGLGTGTSAVRTFSTASLPEESLVIEDFESYADDAAMAAAYPRNSGGGLVAPTLTENPVTGTTAGRFTFDLGAPGYAGVIHDLPAAQSWWGYRGLGMTLDAPQGTTVTVQFVAAGGYWEAQVPVTQAGPQTVEVPFTDFAPPAWAGESRLDLSSVSQFSLYLADTASGDLIVDDIVALAPILVDPDPDPDPEPEPEPEPQPEPQPGGGDPANPVTPGDEPTAPSAAPDDGTLAVTGTNALATAALAALLLLLGWSARRLDRTRKLSHHLR
jgi:hypothetical protein